MPAHCSIGGLSADTRDGFPVTIRSQKSNSSLYAHFVANRNPRWTNIRQLWYGMCICVTNGAAVLAFENGAWGINGFFGFAFRSKRNDAAGSRT